MKLSRSVHESRPWRIHEIVQDFRLEDVWVLPTPGDHDDFPRLVEMVASFDPMKSSSFVVRTLFDIRYRLGGLLGLDDERTGIGARVPTLRDRLPDDLLDVPSGPDFEIGAFTSLYMLDDEWAAEAANETMHGLIHLGWVPDDDGGYRGEMAIYVKRNGLLGTAYMAAITPFRYVLVYPQIMGELAREWSARSASTSATRE